MLAYERHGHGEPLVLVHGVGHRRQAWYPVLDLLTPHRDVILLDLPGHGDSPPLVSDGRPIDELLTDALVEALDELHLARPHVAGNSLGARIALEAALRGHARSATALAPAGFWRSDREFGYTDRLFKTVSAGSKVLAPRAPTLARSAAGRAVLVGWLVAHPGRVAADAVIGDLEAFRRAQPALRQIIAGAVEFSGTIAAGRPRDGCLGYPGHGAAAAAGALGP